MGVSPSIFDYLLMYIVPIALMTVMMFIMFWRREASADWTVWIKGKSYKISAATHCITLHGNLRSSYVRRDPSGDWYVHLVSVYYEIEEWRVMTPVQILELLTTHSQYGLLRQQDQHVLEQFVEPVAIGGV